MPSAPKSTAFLHWSGWSAPRGLSGARLVGPLHEREEGADDPPLLPFFPESRSTTSDGRVDSPA
jgi:hypothetical protein